MYSLFGRVGVGEIVASSEHANGNSNVKRSEGLYLQYFLIFNDLFRIHNIFPNEENWYWSLIWVCKCECVYFALLHRKSPFRGFKDLAAMYCTPFEVNL